MESLFVGPVRPGCRRRGLGAALRSSGSAMTSYFGEERHRDDQLPQPKSRSFLCAFFAILMSAKPREFRTLRIASRETFLPDR
jgi:hypothetical protein